ncbi:hypothetical protein C8Q73DRAFT_745016 [Cubamyces lactineus]|nr:hypothetical protein C8Q73DRAFT_745016 [Cubamyces lactineus]
MSPSPGLLHDYDACAQSIGVTPRLGQDGLPIPIGEQQDRGDVYVVWVRRGIRLFYNCCNVMGLTHVMVCGFSGAAHKWYSSLKAALQGWVEGPTKMADTWRVPAPRAPILTEQTKPISKQAQSSSPQPLHSLPPEISHYHYGCTSLGRSTQHNVWDDGADTAAPVNDHGHDNDDNDGGSSSNKWNYYYDEKEPPVTPSPPSSPTLQQNISSDGNLSFSSEESVQFTTMLTDGTISPHTINTPLFSSPSTSSSTFSSPHAAHPSSPLLPVFRQPFPTSPLIRKRITGKRLERLARINALSTKDRKCYDIVCGNCPGVYFTIHMALEMLGRKPGINPYFVQEYMEDCMGTPVFQDDWDGHADELKLLN